MYVREMTMDDYDEVHALWLSISKFGIRSLDDSGTGIERFLRRNPRTCVVCVDDAPDAESASGGEALSGKDTDDNTGISRGSGPIVGSILCGNDGRRGCLYHVCVSRDYRRRGIGRMMVDFCLAALQREHVNKVCLNAYVTNEGGNAFWRSLGWTLRSDMYYYDYSINEDNVTTFNP